MAQAAPVVDVSDQALVNGVLEGDLSNLPAINSKIVRIFTSSTFTDTAVERNSLMENVYPKLKEYCRENYGLEFQVVDMRWGVRDEATDDHKTTELCMQEIDNCQRLSLGPNFVVFLGQKYGYRPLPTRILEKEFGLIIKILKDEPDDIRLLQTWYKLDSNSLPAVYVLQPVSSVFKNFTNKTEKVLMEEDQNQWWKTMGRLCTVIRNGAKRLLDNKLFTPHDNHRYNWSVTEQEVVRGILEADHNTEHTLGFLREIKNINVRLFQHSAKFIDINFAARTVDEEAQKMLSDLRDVQVPDKLAAENIVRYSINWTDNEGINKDEHARYIEEFSNTFYTRIVDLIERAIAKQKIYPNNQVYAEVLQHLHFCRATTKLFQGREEMMQQVKQYILDEERLQPFVLYGLPGCGKTSILAKIVTCIKQWMPNTRPVIILRFIGTTPESSSIYPLIVSICSQLCILYGEPLENIPEDLAQIINYFKKIVKLATHDKPLFILLDSLDQLSAVNGAYTLSWLPVWLPKNVKVIVSTLSDYHGILNVLRNMVEDTMNYAEVVPLGQSLATTVLNELLRSMKRTISDSQWPMVQESLQNCSSPLYVKLVFDQISLWKSYTVDVFLAPTISDCISKLFERIENQHGKVLLTHALAYITASKNGLSEAELEDLISLDETVLNDIYQYHLPPIRRIPPLLWTRIRNDIPSYLSEREADGISVVYWYHRQFIEVSTNKFLSNAEFRKYIHSQIADYFMGIWANVPKPYTYTEEQKKMFMLKSLSGEADRKVPAQPELFFNPNDNSIRYNRRKLSELPFHLIRSKRIKELNAKTLFNYKFVYAKLCCMPLNSVLMDFEDYISNYKYNKEVALISDALRLSSSILTTLPSNLAPQLVGRLLPYYFMDSKKFKNVKSLIEQCENDGLKDCALIPAYNCFHVPGGPLVYSLEGHPFAVYGISLLGDGLQLVSVSNRFIVFDLTSGDVVRAVNPQIEGIMQTLSISTDKKYCASYTNNDQIVIWGIITNEVKVLDKPNLNPKGQNKKAVKNPNPFFDDNKPKEPFLGINTDYGYLAVWSKYTFYLYNLKGTLIKHEKYKYPIIQIEILQNESIKCCGIELEVISRTEDCNDEEEKDRDYMLLEYKCVFDADKLDKKIESNKNHNISTHYAPTGDSMQLHSVVTMTKQKKRLYTCIEISDNLLECYRNRIDTNKKTGKKKRAWKYHNSLDENADRIYAVVISDNEQYLLAVVLWGFKVYYIKTGQSKPLRLPAGMKNVIIGSKKLTFPAVFSKNNAYVVTGVRDKIYIWDTSYGTLIKTLDAHYGRLNGLIGLYSEQKDLIISCSMDKTIKIWNLKNIMEEEFQLERLEKPVEAIHISTASSIVLAQTRNQLAVFSLKDGRVKHLLCNNPHGAIFTSSALSTNGTYIISVESNRIVIWDMDEVKVTFVSPTAKPSSTIVKQILFFNADLNILCACLNSAAKLVVIENYALPDGEIFYEIEYNLKNGSDFKNFVLSSDETLLGVFRNDKKSDLISIYQTDNGSHVHNIKLQYPNYVYNSLKLHSMATDDLMCVTDSEKGNILNMKEKKFVRSVPKWNGKHTSDDKYGLYAPTRGGLELLDLKDGSKVKTLIPKIAEGVYDVDTDITVNDKHVVYYHSGKRTLRLFRIEDGKQIADFKCAAKVTCMKTAQDSKSLVIGCEDGSVHMFIIADPDDEENVEYLRSWRSEQVKSFARAESIDNDFIDNSQIIQNEVAEDAGQTA